MALLGVGACAQLRVTRPFVGPGANFRFRAGGCGGRRRKLPPSLRGVGLPCFARQPAFPWRGRGAPGGLLGDHGVVSRGGRWARPVRPALLPSRLGERGCPQRVPPPPPGPPFQARRLRQGGAPREASGRQAPAVATLPPAPAPLPTSRWRPPNTPCPLPPAPPQLPPPALPAALAALPPALARAVRGTGGDRRHPLPPA